VIRLKYDNHVLAENMVACPARLRHTFWVSGMSLWRRTKEVPMSKSVSYTIYKRRTTSCIIKITKYYD